MVLDVEANGLHVNSKRLASDLLHVNSHAKIVVASRYGATVVASREQCGSYAGAGHDLPSPPPVRYRTGEVPVVCDPSP
eukprot:7486158-Heterocapsa_arctica.AAC.1